MKLPMLYAVNSKNRTKSAKINNVSIIPSATIYNNSSRNVWIKGEGNNRHCLPPRHNSDQINVDDPDGLLLDGTPVLFHSVRRDLGGGQTHSQGAIKVCNLGSMTISDAPTLNPALIVEISTAGFICPNEPAGYKTQQWCNSHFGWNITGANIVRQC